MNPPKGLRGSFTVKLTRTQNPKCGSSSFSHNALCSKIMNLKCRNIPRQKKKVTYPLVIAEQFLSLLMDFHQSSKLMYRSRALANSFRAVARFYPRVQASFLSFYSESSTKEIHRHLRYTERLKVRRSFLKRPCQLHKLFMFNSFHMTNKYGLSNYWSTVLWHAAVPKKACVNCRLCTATSISHLHVIYHWSVTVKRTLNQTSDL